MKTMKCERRKRKYKCDNGQLSGGMRPRCIWTSDLAVPKKSAVRSHFSEICFYYYINHPFRFVFLFFHCAILLNIFFFFLALVYFSMKNAYFFIFSISTNYIYTYCDSKKILVEFKIVAIYQKCLFFFIFLFSF